MGVIWIASGIMALLTFSIVMFVMRPSPEEKALNKRFVDLKAAGMLGGEFAEAQEDLREFLKETNPGAFGWFEQLIDASVLHRKLQMLILQANSKTTVGTILFSGGAIAAGVTFVAWLFIHVWFVALGIGLVASFIPLMVLRMRRNRRVNRFNAALADCIDMMSRSLRAGHSMVAALQIIAEQAPEPAASEFGEVYKKQNYGLPLRDAFMQLLDRVPSQDLRVFVTGILVQKDTGGNLAEILDRIVFVIRERVRIQGEIRVHTAQGRLTGWILSGLPPILLLIINIVDPGYSDVLFTNPIGREILYTGIVLLAIGAFIIRQIINGIEI